VAHPPAIWRTRDMRRCLVIIARDRPELWVTWASFYGGSGTVQIVVDRRRAPPGPRRSHADRRTQSHRAAALQERGFLVIPEPDSAGS